MARDESAVHTPGKKLHERTLHVQAAGNAIERAVLDVAGERELTPGEIVRILCSLAARWSNYVIRIERHGNTDKKADEA